MVRTAQLLKQTFPAILTTLFLFSLPTGSRGAQAAQQERTCKVYETNVPKGVLEITKINNLQSSSFPQDFEIEVKNISSKPIYYIYIFANFSGSGALPYGLMLRYGRRELAGFELAEEKDVPLLPGKSVILGTDTPVRQNIMPRFKDNDAEWARATSHVNVSFQYLHFGDGTGYMMSKPYPRKN